MESDARNFGNDPGPGDVRPEPGPIGVCPVCAAPLTAENGGEFCPVCMLRSGLGGGAELTGEPRIASASSLLEREFEHYELALSEEGTPVELGRGAMGVTYKAFDLELRCPVALKVITERYLGDESARRRFLREARAAASLRHPNVASVFHLGSSGEHYFYAMEFVEGETLERLIQRSGRLDIGLALEITSQVAAGLAAVHKQNLIHRDIKPTNIMVNREERGTWMVKIIDLGLAKTLNDSAAASAISTPGIFAGTPEFASPEQILGTGVDIRSDLYSLGITLWEMVTGNVPYRGSPAEVMYQHRHKPLPIEQLEAVPQPVVALLEVLLEKTPAHRFQTPTELLELLARVGDAAFTGRRMIKTVRVNLSSSGDVQKERNLADRLMRSIAAEFNLPVSNSDLNFQRLVETDLVLPGHAPEMAPEGLILCPCFWQEEKDGREPFSRAAEFDLTICIVWSRFGPLPGSSQESIHTITDRLERGIELGPVFDHNKSKRETLRLGLYRNCSNPTPPLEPKEEREEFGRQWDALQEFFATWEKEKARDLLGTVHNYRSLEEFEELFRKNFRRFLAERLGEGAGSTVPHRKVRRWKSSPFRGLNVFGFEHSPIFHGRTKAIGEVLDAMDGQVRAGLPFVMVVGASGSGKSSLVQAGVLPLLTQPGTIEGIGLWRRAVTRPGAGGGGDCFDALAAALLEPDGLPALQNLESVNGTRDLARELREHSDSVALRVRDSLDHAAREWKIEHRHQLEQQERQLRAAGRSDDADLVRQRGERIELPKARLALVVDQLEELFTTGFSPEVRQDFVSAIAELVRSGRVFALATLRSDFYPWYQQFPEFIELTRPGGKVDLRPPTPYEIGEMIRLPAEAAGLRFEEAPGTRQRLDEALRDAASATPESLPLLEHVLSLLYYEQASRGDDLLLWSDYRELGELKGALAKYAETVFGTLHPHEQSAFSLVMRYLVTLGQGEEEVPNRRTAPYRDFVAAGQTGDDRKTGATAFVDLFVEKRLFVADTDPQGQVTVSVAHEALLREWQRVREWLAENRDFLRMRDRLDSSLKLWLSRGKQKDDLLGPGLPLAEGEKLAKDFGPSLSREEVDYVDASSAELKRRKQIQERIRYTVLACITAALVAAVIFGVVSFLQYRRAERAKVAADQAAKRASLARNEAAKLINYMTIDLRDKLKPIGRLDLLDDVNQRVEDYYDSLASSENSPEIQWQRSIALLNYGDIRKDRGDLDAALRSYRESLAIREWLVQHDAKNIGWQRELALGLAKVGDALEAQGDSSGALEKYNAALVIQQKAAKQDPNDVQIRREQSFVLESVGVVQADRGDLTSAYKSYQDCLTIRRQLVQQDPSDVERQHELSLIFLKIGRVLTRQGDLNGAAKSYRDSLAIQKDLAAQDPANARWQQELSLSLESVGYGLTEQGDLDGGSNMHREASGILEKLIERDSSNATWQRMLAQSYDDFANVLIMQGDLLAGLKSYRDALAIREKVAKQDPSNAYAQRDLSIADANLGKILDLQGDPASAQMYRSALAISETLAKRDPNNAEWQRDLSINLERLGTVQAAQDERTALNTYRDSMAIRKRLVNRDSSNAQWQNDLSWAYIDVGDILSAQKDLAGALENYHEALAIEEKLVGQDPENMGFQSDLAIACQKVGGILKAQKDVAGALRSYREALTIGEKLVGQDPSNGEWAGELALACYSVATTLPLINNSSDLEIHLLLEKGRDVLMRLQKHSGLAPQDQRSLEDIQSALHSL
jgi:serine/threonine protein kinase/tetratricopeptide (TPR) repeat protein